jgi:hypothetical protein
VAAHCILDAIWCRRRRGLSTLIAPVLTQSVSRPAQRARSATQSLCPWPCLTDGYVPRQTLPGSTGFLGHYCRATDLQLPKTQIISVQSHFESFGTLFAWSAKFTKPGAPNDNLSQCSQCCYRAENQSGTSRQIPTCSTARSEWEPVWQARFRNRTPRPRTRFLEILTSTFDRPCAYARSKARTPGFASFSASLLA